MNKTSKQFTLTNGVGFIHVPHDTPPEAIFLAMERLNNPNNRTTHIVDSYPHKWRLVQRFKRSYRVKRSYR